MNDLRRLRDYLHLNFDNFHEECRDYAIVIVDGKLYKGETHGLCLSNERMRDELFDKLEMNKKIGFYHVIGKMVIMDTTFNSIWSKEINSTVGLKEYSNSELFKILKDNGFNLFVECLEGINYLKRL